MQISEGKRRGLETVSDSRGLIAALAIDQRGRLAQIVFLGHRCTSRVRYRAKILKNSSRRSAEFSPLMPAPFCSIRSRPSSRRQRAKIAACSWPMSKRVTISLFPARLPRLLDGWSVQRLVARGRQRNKDAAVLFDFQSAPINKSRSGSNVGEECAGKMCHIFLSSSPITTKWTRRAANLPGQARDCYPRCRGILRSQYQVDILKVGVPVNMNFVGDVRKAEWPAAYTREQAKEYFRQASAAAKKPFIYLSEGVSNETFSETLGLAAEAGAKFSGVLCGRATWKDGVPIFAARGMNALEDWLSNEGVKNIQRVNARLSSAKPWSRFHDTSAETAVMN